MTCLSCKNWKPKESGAMAREGFAVCAFGPRHTFNSPNHTCAKHAPADAKAVEARRIWLGSR